MLLVSDFSHYNRMAQIKQSTKKPEFFSYSSGAWEMQSPGVTPGESLFAVLCVLEAARGSPQTDYSLEGGLGLGD